MTRRTKKKETQKNTEKETIASLRHEENNQSFCACKKKIRHWNPKPCKLTIKWRPPEPLMSRVWKKYITNSQKWDIRPWNPKPKKLTIKLAGRGQLDYCVRLASLRRPTRLSAPSDSPLCAVRFASLRRPTRLSPPSDSDIFAVRLAPCSCSCREEGALVLSDFLAPYYEP